MFLFKGQTGSKKHSTGIYSGYWERAGCVKEGSERANRMVETKKKASHGGTQNKRRGKNGRSSNGRSSSCVAGHHHDMFDAKKHIRDPERNLLRYQPDKGQQNGKGAKKGSRNIGKQGEGSEKHPQAQVRTQLAG